MSETLFSAVSACSKDLMKFGLSVEEFATLVQKNNFLTFKSNLTME